MLMVMNKNDDNELVAAYFEARLSPDDRAAVESRLAADEDFADKVRLHASLLRLRQRRKNLQLIKQALGKKPQRPQAVPIRSPWRSHLKAVCRSPWVFLAAMGLHVVLIWYLDVHVWPSKPSPDSPNINRLHQRTGQFPISSHVRKALRLSPETTHDSIILRQAPAQEVHPDMTMLVSMEDAGGDSNVWESSIHGKPLDTWLKEHNIEIPKKMDPTALNRVTVAAYICLVAADQPARLQQMVIFCDLDLDAPKYFFGQTLFLFLQKDPRGLDLQQLYLLPRGRKHLLYFDKRTYLIRASGSLDLLVPIP